MYLLGLAALSVVGVNCPVVQGAIELFRNSADKIFWFGEMHGTKQQPQMFADLVCAASDTGRPVVVGLERGTYEQAGWDRFLTSTGDAKSIKSLLAQWPPANDGRYSLSMLSLACRLRYFNKVGRVVGVEMIVSDWAKLPSERFSLLYEQGMARRVEDMRRRYPRAIVMIYSGSAHAQRTAHNDAGVSYQSAAALLPRGAIVSVLMRSGAGYAWNCDAAYCEVHRYSKTYSSDHARSVVLSRKYKGFDGVAFTGTITSPSAPAQDSWSMKSYAGLN